MFEFALEEAFELICGPRMEYYGPPHENFQDIADIWTPYIRRAIELKGKIDTTDVCALMILLKCIRQVRGYHRDSTVDVAGYAQLMETLNEPEAMKAFILRASEKIEDPEKRKDFVKRVLGESDGS